jgi:hypothetical protein
VAVRCQRRFRRYIGTGSYWFIGHISARLISLYGSSIVLATGLGSVGELARSLLVRQQYGTSDGVVS